MPSLKQPSQARKRPECKRFAFRPLAQNEQDFHPRDDALGLQQKAGVKFHSSLQVSDQPEKNLILF